jgi:hypothetical protein
MNSSVVLLAADNNGRGSNQVLLQQSHARLGVEIGMLRQTQNDFRRSPIALY